MIVGLRWILFFVLMLYFLSFINRNWSCHMDNLSDLTVDTIEKKVVVCFPVRNEEKSLQNVLEALKNQKEKQRKISTLIR